MKRSLSGESFKSSVSRWVPARIRDLSLYPASTGKGMLKLDAMENPYVWPEDIRRLWQQELHKVPLNCYPDPQASALCEQLKKWCGLNNNVGLMLGNGSDELIQIIAMTLGGPDRVILAPEPSFAMYSLIAQVIGAQYVGVRRTANFDIDLPALLDAIDEHNPCCIFLAHPNNPTGNLCTPEVVERVLDAAGGLVVLDEAYHAFSRSTFLDLVGDHDNLIVIRTFSKLGLAALRLGFLAGPKDWLAEFNKVRLPYNINTLTQASVCFALHHMDWFEGRAALIRDERTRLLRALEGVPGLTVYPSAGNFLLVRTPAGSGQAVFEGLKDGGILVKNLHSAHPALAECLRVTVSTREHNESLYKLLSEVLAQLGR
ncbi:MAG: histidinol-phosphate transaminase [Arenicellales bacterium]|jgi:histidinol-phosphate aminotransferase|nr:histidinol-phosphate transaminase [Arenicellales bacterium]HJP09414.1 histidinol-phosphate transaminase [Arenicellales bacterium]